MGRKWHSPFKNCCFQYHKPMKEKYHRFQMKSFYMLRALASYCTCRTSFMTRRSSWTIDCEMSKHTLVSVGESDRFLGFIQERSFTFLTFHYFSYSNICIYCTLLWWFCSCIEVHGSHLCLCTLYFLLDFYQNVNGANNIFRFQWGFANKCKWKPDLYQPDVY